MPFMAVLTDPSLIEKNATLQTIYLYSGADSNRGFLLFLGSAVFCFLVSSMALKALSTYLQLRFTQIQEYLLATRLVEGYLQQPYSWFFHRNSGDLSKVVLSEVATVVSQGFGPMLALISQSISAFALLIIIVIVDPMVAMIACAALAFAYGAVFLLTSSFLMEIGRERVKANELRYTALMETLGAIKEVKVAGVEKVFAARFEKPALAVARYAAAAKAIAHLPRYAMEVIAFGGLLLVVLYLISTDGNQQPIIPILAVYAFAGYRLMPALQQIYSSLSQLRFVSPGLSALTKELAAIRIHDDEDKASDISFESAIELSGISFSYKEGHRRSLSDINLTIKKGSRVAFVGPTGSGKTTLVDVLLGLLVPQKGEVLIDGTSLTYENARRWRSCVGYVPQEIFLGDTTISGNIAFGVEPEDIDHALVETTAKMASLHNFVSAELPNGYETPVGDRGLRLSGGQRQRIGLARALYGRPDVLILDEATSALDGLTEQVVMDEIGDLGDEVTIIKIAHRLTTVRDCDVIFVIENGKIKDSGKFDELVRRNEHFKLAVTRN